MATHGKYGNVLEGTARGLKKKVVHTHQSGDREMTNIFHTLFIDLPLLFLMSLLGLMLGVLGLLIWEWIKEKK